MELLEKPEKYEEQVKKQTEIERHLTRVQKTLEFFKSYGWTDKQVADLIGELGWKMGTPGIDPYYLRHPGQQ